MQTIKKAAALVLAVWVLGFGALLVRPAYAAAKEAITNVFITNTADNPVPVAPQGTTNIAGTVTVANPTPAAKQPVLVQKTFREQAITRERPFATGELYRVPDGKVLTIEYFQAHWLFSGIGLRQADIAVGCLGQTSSNPNVDFHQIFFPDEPAGVGYHVVGGAVTLHAPAGSCVTYEVGANYADFPNDGSNLTLYVYGGFTGYLTDAAA